jgi:hypothetical protein
MRWAGSEVALVLGALGACTLSNPLGKVHCETDDNCLPGRVCVDRVCRAPSEIADGGAGETAGADDASVAPRCRSDEPFGPPVLRDDLDGLATGWLTLAPDELTIYGAAALGSDPNDIDIYAATRASSDDRFGPFAPLAGVNTTAAEWSPVLAADGLSLYYTSNLERPEIYYIRRSRRSAAGAAFDGGAMVPELYSGFGDGDPFATADDLAMYFVSLRPGGFGNLDLYFAERPDAERPFSAPRLLTALSSPSSEYHPVLSRDQLTIYFASLRPDGGAQGGNDIWVARRQTRQDSFGDPQPAANLNSVDDDAAGWISADDCVLYLASTRQDHATNRIYQATRGR